MYDRASRNDQELATGVGSPSHPPPSNRHFFLFRIFPSSAEQLNEQPVPHDTSSEMLVSRVSGTLEGGSALVTQRKHRAARRGPL